jgi:hypothetical protein
MEPHKVHVGKVMPRMMMMNNKNNNKDKEPTTNTQQSNTKLTFLSIL